MIQRRFWVFDAMTWHSARCTPDLSTAGIISSNT
jgi:hypothetical protein